MDTAYAERVLLRFTEALQASSQVKGQHDEQANNAVSFICDVASHFFSGVEVSVVDFVHYKIVFFS